MSKKDVTITLCGKGGTNKRTIVIKNTDELECEGTWSKRDHLILTQDEWKMLTRGYNSHAAAIFVSLLFGDDKLREACSHNFGGPIETAYKLREFAEAMHELAGVYTNSSDAYHMASCIAYRMAVGVINDRSIEDCYVYGNPSDVIEIIDDLFFNKNDVHPFETIYEGLVNKFHEYERVHVSDYRTGFDDECERIERSKSHKTPSERLTAFVLDFIKSAYAKTEFEQIHKSEKKESEKKEEKSDIPYKTIHIGKRGNTIIDSVNDIVIYDTSSELNNRVKNGSLIISLPQWRELQKSLFPLAVIATMVYSDDDERKILIEMHGKLKLATSLAAAAKCIKSVGEEWENKGNSIQNNIKAKKYHNTAAKLASYAMDILSPLKQQVILNIDKANVKDLKTYVSDVYTFIETL